MISLAQIMRLAQVARGEGGGELRLSGNHAVTEYEMSGEQSNSGWLNNSNERIFQVMTFK